MYLLKFGDDNLIQNFPDSKAAATATKPNRLGSQSDFILLNLSSSLVLEACPSPKVRVHGLSGLDMPGAGSRTPLPWLSLNLKDTNLQKNHSCVVCVMSGGRARAWGFQKKMVLDRTAHSRIGIGVNFGDQGMGG